MSDPTKKKRKWDVAAPGSENQSVEDPAAAATIAAKKLNAMLAAQGVANIQAFEREVDVNSCRPETRYYLCRGTTHDEIQMQTGSTIRVRGKFKPPGDNTLERPLHLYITANNQQSLDSAVARIQEIIKGDQVKQASVNEGVKFLAKVFVGMEGTDSQFDVLSRVLGPGGSYITHIQNASKASVVLKGVGSGQPLDINNAESMKEAAEPLHLFINAK